MQPGHQFQVLPLNSNPLNRQARQWLKEAKEWADPGFLHVLNLAAYGLEHRALGPWPNHHRTALEEQISHLGRWKAEDAMGWMLDNPEGPPPAEQEASLLQSLRQAASPIQASAVVLEQIYSRMQAQIPALRPAASDPTSSVTS